MATANTLAPQVRKSERTSASVKAAALKLSQRDGAAPHSAIAEELGMSEATVKRALFRLRESEEIAWDLPPHTLKTALRYRVPGEEVSGRSELQISNESAGRADGSIFVTPDGKRDSEDVVCSEEDSQSSINSPSHQSINSSLHTSTTDAPLPGVRRASILDGRIGELVQLFEGYVAPRSKRAITSNRRQRWYYTAYRMIFEQHRSLDQIRDVLAYVFDKQAGTLPSWFEVRWRDGYRVTRLAQIAEHFDELVNAMAAKDVRAVQKPLDAVKGVAKKVTSDKVNYNRPLPDEGLEAQVEQLVQAFAEFRRIDQLDDFRKFQWTKTFRLLLHHDQRPFDEIISLVTGLGDHTLRRWVDVSRYNSPFDIRREYDDSTSQIRFANKLAEMVEKQRPPHPSEPQTSTRQWVMEDMNYGPAARDNSTTWESSDMASNVEERRRRHEEGARAARNPFPGGAR